MMLAAFYTRPGSARDVLRVSEVNKPTPGRGEVRVKLCVSGVNPADVKRRAGAVARTMQFPIVIPHNDGAGVIDAVGAGVCPSREGERVWVWNGQWERPFGTAAEFITLASAQAVGLPATAPFELGAALGVPGLTAHRCVSALGDLRGRTVLVFGAGGAVGHLVVQLAKARGARVVGVVRTVSTRESLEAVGVDACLAIPHPSFVQAARAVLMPHGADHIVDVDYAANSGWYTALLARHGSVVVFGSASDMRPAVDVLALQKHGVTLHFIAGADQPMASRERAIEELQQMLTEQRLSLWRHAIYRLGDIVEAHERLETGSFTGKVLLDIASCAVAA